MVATQLIVLFRTNLLRGFYAINTFEVGQVYLNLLAGQEYPWDRCRFRLLVHRQPLILGDLTTFIKNSSPQETVQAKEAVEAVAVVRIEKEKRHGCEEIRVLIYVKKIGEGTCSKS